MKRTTAWLSIVTVIMLVAALSGCLDKKKKVVELILTAETCGEWDQDSASEVFEDTDTIDVSGEIDSALESAGVPRDSILAAWILGGSYGSTSFTVTGPPDWLISGAIEIERVGGASATIINYTSASVKNSLGQKIPVPLEAAGVALLQAGLDDYLAGQDNIVFIYRILNGDVEPDPSPTERIVFSWKAWINIQIKMTEGFELIDPWGEDSPTAP
jgi:hypothetical protein